jgi:beta-glucosidase
VELEAGRLYDLRLDYVNDRTDHEPQVRLLWKTPQSKPLAQAMEVAREAEAVILVLGLSPALEGEEMPVDIRGFHGGDRTEIRLPRPQEELLRLVNALGKPLVLVLLSGSALAIPWAAEKVPAIVQAWYPGQAGDAVADVLFGDYNPAGRLPVTVYGSVDDLPPFETYAMEGRTYRYFRGEALFPFGHGLSYTRFAYSNLRLSTDTLSPGESLTVSVDVQNVGKRAGDEVVQLYVTDVEASVPVPIRHLAGLERVHLTPGEVRRIRFAIRPRQLSLIDDQGRRVIELGTFRVAVGGCQPIETVAAGSSLADGDGAVLTAVFDVAAPVTS